MGYLINELYKYRELSLSKKIKYVFAYGLIWIFGPSAIIYAFVNSLALGYVGLLALSNSLLMLYSYYYWPIMKYVLSPKIPIIIIDDVNVVYDDKNLENYQGLIKGLIGLCLYENKARLLLISSDNSCKKNILEIKGMSSRLTAFTLPEVTKDDFLHTLDDNYESYYKLKYYPNIEDSNKEGAKEAFVKEMIIMYDSFGGNIRKMEEYLKIHKKKNMSLQGKPIILIFRLHKSANRK